MTAQISDTVTHRGVRYGLKSIEAEPRREYLFDPTEHGLRTEFFSTACWRGFHCSFAIEDDSLWLTEVCIGLHIEQRQALEAGGGPSLFGRAPRRTEECDGLSFDGLREPISLSGRMLLADDFIDDLYIHAGFQLPWNYRLLLELRFEGGRLIDERDRSDDAARLRAELHASTSDDTEPLDERAERHDLNY